MANNKDTANTAAPTPANQIGTATDPAVSTFGIIYSSFRDLAEAPFATADGVTSFSFIPRHLHDAGG
jgi:hypothetical protein